MPTVGAAFLPPAAHPDPRHPQCAHPVFFRGRFPLRISGGSVFADNVASERCARALLWRSGQCSRRAAFSVATGFRNRTLQQLSSTTSGLQIETLRLAARQALPSHGSTSPMQSAQLWRRQRALGVPHLRRRLDLFQQCGSVGGRRWALFQAARGGQVAVDVRLRAPCGDRWSLHDDVSGRCAAPGTATPFSSSGSAAWHPRRLHYGPREQHCIRASPSLAFPRRA